MTDESDLIEQLRAEVAALRRRLAELEGAVESEAELLAMFGALHDLVFVLDRDGRYIKIAPTANELLYLTIQEMLGKTMHDVLPRELADLFVARIREAIDRQRDVSVEYSIDIHGRHMWFQGSIYPTGEGKAVFIARDITEARRANEALRRLLEELSTPLIPLSASAVVMPLVGAIDADRSERILEALLSGVAGRRAEMAILDVTGVPVVDAPVAEALVRAARAARLLGAQVVLTGLRPEVARALVEIGADLSGVVTCGTLQDGIALAMAQRRRARP